MEGEKKTKPMLIVDLTHDEIIYSDDFFLIVAREGVKMGTLDSPVALTFIGLEGLKQALKDKTKEEQRGTIKNIEEVLKELKATFGISTLLQV